MGRLVIVGLVGAMLTAACGARWDGDQQAEIRARYATHDAGGAGLQLGAAPTEGGGEETVGSTTAAADPTAGTSSGQDGADGTPQAGPQAPSGDGQARQAPCSQPTDASGVTDDQIEIGAISSLSGPVPGLGTTFEAGVRAYVAHRNATGGVCGRELSLKPADDGGDPATNRSLMTDLDKTAIGVLTGPAGGSDGGATVATENNTPVVGIAINERMDSVPSFFNVNPRVSDTGRVLAKYRYLKDQGVTKAAVVYVEQGAQEARTHRDLMRSAGIEVVFDRSFSVATFSYDSLARAVANSDADYLYFLHEFGAAASMAQSMADTGHDLKFHENVTAYGTDYINAAGSAAEGTVNWLFALPVEDAGSNQELDKLIQWMGQVAPGLQIDVFAAEGWASAKLFVENLEALSGPIDRGSILAGLNGTGDWDADGLVGKINVGAGTTGGCLVAMVVDGAEWRRLTPAQGFLC